ncbi:hypothetical protein scyTo_0021595 [Scyliorhinus torazame]|uniref:Endonuclease domain-containing 1 protein n=1 Tax=Scyliorhinus torazame TaxID=75743 RepID=A0A401QAK3_SCYTO|nr:hypothetical protein [Scyliorhinus torazame]
MSRRLRCCSLVLLWNLIAPRATEGKVVQSFDECSQFFCEGIEPFMILNTTRICQRYNNEYHFATVYSTALRIPWYSAYKYQPGSNSVKPSRPPKFFIEPQLDLPGGSDEMSKEPPDGVGMNQALNKDYTNKSYHRGHLCPFSFHDASSISTCTLTNVVPKLPELNRLWYHGAEKLINILSELCEPTEALFVITGAIPSSQFLNERVNIPLMVYSFYSCCSGEEQKKRKKKKEECASRSGGYTLRMDKNNAVVEAVTLAKLQESFGSLIEVNPAWVRVAVSKSESQMVEVISEFFKPSWAKRIPSLELRDIVATLFDALSFVARCVYDLVVWTIYRVFSGVVFVALAIISMVVALVNLLLASIAWLILAILRLIGGIFGRIGVLLTKGLLFLAKSLLGLITGVAKFLLISIASIPTYIIGIAANLFTLLSCVSCLLPILSFSVSLVSLFFGTILVIAIRPNLFLNLLSKLAQYITKLMPSVVKTHPPPSVTWNWLRHLISTFQDLMPKFWTLMFDIPSHWKMLLAIVSFLPSLLLGGWVIVVSVLGGLFSLISMVTAGIFGTIAIVVLGLEALVLLLLQTVVSLCVTGPAWIFTTLIPRSFQYLATAFSKYSVYSFMYILAILICICFIQVLVKVFSSSEHPQQYRYDNQPTFKYNSVKLNPTAGKVYLSNVTPTAHPVSVKPPGLSPPSQIPVQPNTEKDTAKVYFSYAKGFCAENIIPILIIVPGVLIDHAISCPFPYGDIRIRTLAVAVAVLVSVVTDGTSPRYSRAFLVAAIAAAVIVVYNVITYFITGVYNCMCMAFTNIGPIIFLVIVIGIGVMIASGGHLDCFPVGISANLPISLTTTFLNIGTAIKEASRYRLPTMLSLLVIIFILLIQRSDSLNYVVTEFLQLIFAGILAVLALVIKESIHPRI